MSGANQSLESISGDAMAAELAVPLLVDAAEHDSLDDYLAAACRMIQKAVHAESIGLFQGAKGVWRTNAITGPGEPPTDLLAEALDEGSPQQNGRWLAASLKTEAGDVIAVERLQAEQPASTLATIALLISQCLKIARTRSAELARVKRLEAMLEIAAQWQQTLDMNDLLQNMAETSTRLLKAERASIFLWDKRNKKLIGRPALGVEGNELLIPHDAGIVGQVVQTGEPRRVDIDIASEQSEIDRTVDKKLDFQTRSIVCVPLRNGDGELIGAFEVLNKHSGCFTDDDEAALVELASHAGVALDNTQHFESMLQNASVVADQAAEGVKLIGDCPAVAALRSTVNRIADTDLAVLILGENGTGKEVVSQMIHYHSDRRNQAFVAVNCAAISETLLESELFGHEKGAFTDAHDTRIGKFELASGGTLFLDEIGDMSLGGQAKLLRVLEEKTVVRVGGSVPIFTDARVIAATNQNLAQMVQERKFREDLYYRLNVATLELPPLRERGDDILLLAEFFIRDFSAKARRNPPKFAADARARLLSHAWPGNVRELRNLMERLAYLLQGDKINASDLAFILAPGVDPRSTATMDLPLTEATQDFQSEYIQQHIDRARGNMTEAARSLGLHRSNLYRKMKQLDMETNE